MSIIGPFQEYLNLKKLFPTDESKQQKQYFFEKCSKQYDLRELVVDCMHDHMKQYERDLQDFKMLTASILKQFELQKKTKEQTFTEQQITQYIDKLAAKYISKFQETQ